MYSLYLHRGDPGPGVIIDDGDYPISQGWFQKPAHWISSRYQYLRTVLCGEYNPFVNRQWHYDLCKHVPRKPRPTPNHRKLLSKWRMRRLQALMPKWFRAPYDQMPLTRSNIVLSVLDLLEELKRNALRDHNIRITSAIISRPTWVYSDMDFFFKDACFLAGIECLELSHDRAEIVTKTALPGSSVLVLDHGQYHLDFRHAVWDELNKKHVIQGSMGTVGFGSLTIMEQLIRYITGNYIANATQEEEEDHLTIVDIQYGVQQVATAIQDLRYAREWPIERDLENRSISITFRQYTSNWTTMINMTGQDVVGAENQYIKETSNSVRIFLARSSVNDYRQSQSYFDRDRTPQEDLADILNVVANVTPPAEIGSWFQHIDHLIILDTTMNTELLRTAVEKALGWDNTGVGEMCIPTATFAARGAALRARQWGNRYDNDHWPRRWDEDERDWVPVGRVGCSWGDPWGKF
ncbi:uncharacterized protein PAC_01311 [Phialocephala subalpina]|uniref:Uncharacterized protein n=1 Tax=Phialocephala subalpina TaxID=576137 RepID=A0A1L7WF99_9HELO|nr:uncharacterized protein PAC_01311 [Phialocephala subalpina]